MELAAVLERAAGVDVGTSDRAGICGVLADLARITAWVEARRVSCVRRLHELADVTFPDTTVAEATRESAREAQRLVRRAATLALFPRFEKALEAAEITVAHVDVVTNAVADVPADKRERVVAAQDHLLDAARRLAPESFTRTARDTVRRVLSVEDTRDRLRRQQTATALSWWTNKATGMLQLRGRFNPETGAELVARLESARQLLYPDQATLPDSCPKDPGEREDHLRALTLAELLLGAAAPGWRPEALVVTDQRTLDEGLHDHSIVDIGIDADLPVDALCRLVDRCEIVPIVIRDGVVTSVGGRSNLNLGRSSRLANLDQRRALRAMYPRCAIPDCPVRFRHCKIHHVKWWEHGYGTDLENLLPLCSRHHHAVHDHGWTLLLDPATRVLTVTLPDGTTVTSPPPYAQKGSHP